MRSIHSSKRSLAVHVLFAGMAAATLAAIASACASGLSSQTAANGANDPAGSESQRGQPAQFDNGSYEMTKNGTVIGTFYVNANGTYKELWVFASDNCGDTNCDISGATITKIMSDGCSAWKKYAESLDAGTKNVYGAEYESDSLNCDAGSECKYAPKAPTHSFSVFPPGRYTQNRAVRPRIFVEAPDADIRREYWIMDSFIDAAGANLVAADNDAGLSTFACGACGDDNPSRMKVYKVTYTNMDGGIDCDAM